MFNCFHCDKSFTKKAGRTFHSRYCDNNPDRIYSWNAGLTKEADRRVLKYSESLVTNDQSWRKLSS